jgi:hypothetical protein
MDKITLVHQPVPPRGDDTSFAVALESVLEGTSPIDTLDIVSPYLGWSVVKPLTANRGFRLITDIDACFEASVEPDLVQFFETHRDKVKNLPGVHAKVVIGSKAALFGSANLTRHGLCKRFEMGCVVEGAALQHLQRWFDDAWKHATELDMSKIRTAAAEGERVSRTRREGRTSSSSRVNTGSLGWMAGGDPQGATRGSGATGSRSGAAGVHPQVPNDEIDELATEVRALTSGRDDAKVALRWLSEALQLIDLPADDKRLHLNFGNRQVIVCLGQRAVAWLWRKAGVGEFGMILDDFDVARRYGETVSGARAGSFSRPAAPSLDLPPLELKRLPALVKESWRRAVRRELERCSVSSYHAKKRISLYAMLIDERLREEAVRRAYPVAWWFGVNNGEKSKKGHMHLVDVLPLLDGGMLRWSIDHSKGSPTGAYGLMCPGDSVLIWTGHGQSPDWGVLGVAQISSVAEDHVILSQGSGFARPLVPYPKRKPSMTPSVELLFRVLGEDFAPLGDVRKAIRGEGKSRPITVAEVPERAFAEIVAFAATLSDS